nr:MAG TPA: hypothetical protein [Crassvirales sp.]
MMCRSLHKFPMYRTYYGYFCLSIKVFYFTIIILVSMNLPSFFYKIFNR